jgi:hypothetical protein
MTAWTYKMVFIAGKVQDAHSYESWRIEMNEHGKEGWEAFSIVREENGWWVVFKRPVT